MVNPFRLFFIRKMTREEDDYDEMIGYLSECGALNGLLKADCYKEKRLSQFVPNTVRKFFSKRSVFVEDPEENMEDDEE